MIVDTHVHVVTADRDAYPQSGAPPKWPATPVEDLLSFMETASIDRALLVQSYFTYGYDNRYAIDAALAHPERFRSVVVLDPFSPDAPGQLRDMVENRGVAGIRMMADAELSVALDAEGATPLWRRAAELRVPVCVACLIGDVPRVIGRLEAFPEMVVCMDHIWGLDVGIGPDHARIQPVLALSRFPNVHLKIAPNNSHSLRKNNGDAGTFYSLLVRTFGADRILWGSNFPAHPAAYGTLEDRLDLMRSDLAFLPESDRAAIFGGNALRLWPTLA